MQTDNRQSDLPTHRLGGREYLIDITSGGEHPVEDVQDRIRAITREAPRDPAAEEAFIRARLGLALSLGNRQAVTRSALQELVNLLPDAATTKTSTSPTAFMVTPPTPGGVGYGMFYNEAFRTAFATGTVLAVDIITPRTVGGNNANWLYLTACNRAAKGVEAFVSYYGQEEARFKVFDWARDDHWQVDIGYSTLKDYITNKSFHGGSYPVVGIQNQTFAVSGNTWRNVVYLYNQVQKRYDRIYQYDYTSTSDEQRTGWVGSWGPIVETFQDSYSNVNALGFYRTFLQARSSQNQWSAWALLGAGDSTVRNDNKGFKLQFLDPNHTFAVR